MHMLECQADDAGWKKRWVVPTHRQEDMLPVHLNRGSSSLMVHSITIWTKLQGFAFNLLALIDYLIIFRLFSTI